jgi:hypothetical protein
LNILNVAQDQFEAQLQELAQSTSLTREEKTYRLMSQVDRMLRDPESIEYLYEKTPELIEANVFKDTSWENPSGLIPRLVGGTLKAGSPTADFELLSELRMLAISNAKVKVDGISPLEAESFLESVIVHNLDLIYGHLDEAGRIQFSKNDLIKIENVFEFILDHISLKGIKAQIAEELQLLSAQRPIFTIPMRNILKLVHDHFELDLSQEIDQNIAKYRNAIAGPTKISFENNYSDYQAWLKSAERDNVLKEANLFGRSMHETGLVSIYHIPLLQHLFESEDLEGVIAAFGLDESGSLELRKHYALIRKLILKYSTKHYAQAIYGIARSLERGIFSPSVVSKALNHLLTVRVNKQVKQHLISSRETDAQLEDAHKILIGGTMNMLGNPLGVGQGLNPTCQSARALSLWSKFAPAKLVNQIITAAVENNLRFRFEGDMLESKLLIKGLASEFDYSLDPVSVVLVPHLDKIYNEMMKRASYRGEDPHKWVNPAFYGHWIPNGFMSAYNYMNQSIHQYEEYVKVFFAAFHPDYNQGKQVTYPIPIGLFITSSKAEFLGFHAVSLLRVDKDPDGQIRVYFLNPNNEGRQDWGQDIKPSVYSKGEIPGESSLPFTQFVARSYAFHYTKTGIEERKSRVPSNKVEEVVQLAKASWGKKYIWT